MTFINFHIKRFYFDFGWYSGNEFKLFGLILFNKIEGISLNIFEFQCIKLIIDFGINYQ
jgi:hypothetical protein